MSTLPPPEKVSLRKNTKRLIFRRSMWRRRAIGAAMKLATWQTGALGRDECEAELSKAMNKIRVWFRAPRATLVIRAIERRSIAAWRRSSESS